MMLRVAGGFLDIDEEIFVEKRTKLFESLDETLGDFSYTFELQKTQNNLNLLSIPLADVYQKTIYNRIDTEALDDEGDLIYTGFLRIESITDVISCSFFSGNYNWISRLTGQISEGIDFSDLDTSLTNAAIIATFTNETGIAFPIIDAGGLIRSEEHTSELQSQSNIVCRLL